MAEALKNGNAQARREAAQKLDEARRQAGGDPAARKAAEDALKDAARGSTEGRRQSRVRNTLVIAEIAFACVLLVGAGLLMRSFVQVLDVNLGFQPEQAATIRVDPDKQYATPEQRRGYFDQVLNRGQLRL